MNGKVEKEIEYLVGQRDQIVDELSVNMNLSYLPIFFSARALIIIRNTELYSNIK